jgi:hypothetical protein
MAHAPFPIVPYLTAIAITYRNKRLIADDVLPRTHVGAQEFTYFKLAVENGFTIPDTRVGRTSQPNQVEFTGEEVAAATRDRALDDPVPNADIENARNNPTLGDPLGKATEYLTDLIALDREVRVAAKVFDPANYGTNNKASLEDEEQFSDFEHSDPIGVIQGALDSMIMRGNKLVMGRVVASTLVRHPKIVNAFNGTAGDSGIVPLAFLAQLFELDQILIGEGWVNTARKGQPPDLQRVWGNALALIYSNPLATVLNGTTFGFSAEWGARIAGSIPDNDIGMRGGVRVRVGESLAEVITAPDLGYLITDIVAPPTPPTP